MHGVLPDIYFQNYLLFVEAIFILLSSSVSRQDLKKAGRLLSHFCLIFGKLYGDRQERINVHLLLHLCDFVKLFGPLFCYSCFPFEDFNGLLKSLVKGSQHAEAQIVNSVSIIQKLPELAKQFYLKEQIFTIAICQ